MPSTGSVQVGDSIVSSYDGIPDVANLLKGTLINQAYSWVRVREIGFRCPVHYVSTGISPESKIRVTVLSVGNSERAICETECCWGYNILLDVITKRRGKS